ncbi:MAG: UDP-glucose/GDP-mannose dehydrogenase family protein [Planctomycetes bacterium]|nr:UDP-glucose/GDP-mannose dehydrogenase family protein [Planctomycetota bacterium]
MKISVFGTGYVGLVTGACFADLGNDVVCYDIDEQKIAALKAGKVPIYEPGLEELIQRNAAEGRLIFTTEVAEAVRGREVVFICVGTPQRTSGKADVTYVLQAAEQIARHMDGFLVVITKSTVPVGTAERVARVLRETTTRDFEVVSNPEFLKEGAAIKDFQNPDRVIVGAESERAREVLGRLYSPIARVNRPILFMQPQAAELSKYAANAMLASRISFMNSLTGLCEKIGVDVKDISRAIGLDTRIGPRFLQASPGYGGSCFPKDVRALVDTMESLQLNANFFRAIDQVNELHKKSHLARVQRFVPDLHGKTIGVWGLAFKPRTDDIRESPSITLIEQLLEAGARPIAYDPEAAENTRKVFPAIEYGRTPYDAVRDASAVVVMTEWDVFRSVDFARVKALMTQPVIVDCRNIYDAQEMVRLGFHYAGVGRPAVEAQVPARTLG